MQYFEGYRLSKPIERSVLQYKICGRSESSRGRWMRAIRFNSSLGSTKKVCESALNNSFLWSLDTNISWVFITIKGTWKILLLYCKKNPKSIKQCQKGNFNATIKKCIKTLLLWSFTNRSLCTTGKRPLFTGGIESGSPSPTLTRCRFNFT